jgi:hypothetical protein
MRFTGAGGAVLLMISGCSIPSGKAFDTPYADAHRMVKGTEVPYEVFGSAYPHVDQISEGPSKIIWVMKRDGNEMMRYIADITAIDATSTRVAVSLDGPVSGFYGNVHERLAKNRSIRAMYIVAMEEKIAASIERREFDVTKVFPSMMLAVAANHGSMFKTPDRKEAAYQQEQEDSIEQAYADDNAEVIDEVGEPE